MIAMEENQTIWNAFLGEEESNTSTNWSNGSEVQVQSDEANWWTSVIYPSGYTPLSLLIASIFVTFIMTLIVGGNTLVIIAIATERSLKGIQNWFIASLAVADCLLGLIIMPFSLANEMMGYWVFGQWWCDIHSAVDVLLCTSSIMNICLISLDRYWSITHAIEYLRKRTPERVAIMITVVWILSGLISIPPLLGWKKETPQGKFPTCELSNDTGYVLYSALGSFYIPSCIMVFVYIRIYFAARERSRRQIANKLKKRQTQTMDKRTNCKSSAPPPDASNILPSGRDKCVSAKLESMTNAVESAAATILSTTKPTTTTAPASALNGPNVLQKNLDPPLDIVPTPGSPLPSGQVEESSYTADLYSTAPCSLLAMDEVNDVEDDSDLPKVQLPFPASTKNGSNKIGVSSSTKHCVTFDCNSAGRVTYTTVRCSIDDEIIDLPQQNVFTMSDIPLELVVDNNEQHLPELVTSIMKAGSPMADRRSSLFIQGQKNNTQQPQRAMSEPTPDQMFAKIPEFDKPEYYGELLDNNCSSPDIHLPDKIFDEADVEAVEVDLKERITENEMVSEIEPSSSDSGTVARCTSVRPLKIRFCRPSSTGSLKKSSKAKRQVIDTGRLVVRDKDPARERRRINRQREKRATFILGLIMGAFILCWLPFFFLYLLAPLCPSCNIQPWGFAFAFWLGYINSALNPVIYTIFNKDFRRAFRRIIFRCSIAPY